MHQAPESATNYLSFGCVRRSEGEKNAALRIRFCHFPRVSPGASFLFQNIFLRPVLTFWSMSYAHENQCAEPHLAMDLSFPIFQVTLSGLHATRFRSSNTLWNSSTKHLSSWLSTSMCMNEHLSPNVHPILFCTRNHTDF